MKIHEIQINNLRGVRELVIEPADNSFVVYGPNGSGKSAVVDAIEFLFTGKITRLTGRGTSGITLPKYGPHIDVIDNPEESWVKAKVKIPGTSDLIEIQRSMDNPSTYVCEDQFRPQIDNIMEMAHRGQHILSRREILKYVTAEKGVRGKEIQNLLKLNRVENIRKNLVKIANHYDAKYESDLDLARRDAKKVCIVVGIEDFEDSEIIKFINNQRKILGGSAISDLSPDVIRSDLTPPSESGVGAVNTAIIEESTMHLLSITGTQKREHLDNNLRELAKLMLRISSDTALIDALKNERLLSLGLENIDNTGKCPLCEYLWPPGEIKAIIEHRLEMVKQISSLKSEIINHQRNIVDILLEHNSHTKRIVENLQNASMTSETQFFQKWISDVSILLARLDMSIKDYSKLPFTIDEAIDTIIPPDIKKILLSMLQEVKRRFPSDVNLQRVAWDKLTELITQISDMNETIELVNSSSKMKLRAENLQQSFVIARDIVLGGLLETVRDRFVELYCQIHSEDEADFKAKLELEDAACDLQVDFHGRDLHPPHALHSEGHQDCMGLCLYLAIVENLSGGVIDLIVLDDVVMSIDADHRRGVCDIISGSFSDKQFLITTHDKTWAYQLKSLLQLDKKSFRQFSNWSIDLGPETEFEEPIWDAIYDLIDRNEISIAAARLRRWLEQFMNTVCNDLRAATRHRLDGRHELGDLLSGALSRYTRLLKKAKNAAGSWKDKEAIDAITEAESIKNQIASRIGEEYWSINAAVHYNEWTDFTPSDFRPVVEAFEDLCNLFLCQRCMTNLQVAIAGTIEKTVTCDCTGTMWNLKTK